MINNKNKTFNKKRKKKVISWKNPLAVDLLKNSIRNNSICITSTDTILGLITNLTEAGFEKLNNIKEKRSEKPYLILISSKEKLPSFIDTTPINPKIINLINNCWPGPLTIIFKAKKGLPYFLTSKGNTIALRSPKHEYLQNLLESFGGLFSTSANKTTEPPPKNINQVASEIIEKVEYIIIDEEKNDLTVDTNQSILQTLPSTIIDVSSGQDVKIIRKGAYPIEELEKHYGSKFKKAEG